MSGTFFDRLKQRLETAAFDAIHGAIYLASGSARHEGHFEGGVWHNWSDSYEVRPAHYRVPETVEALAQIVADAQKVRVVGGGHTFNESPLSPDTLVSLDKLNRVISVEPATRRARVQTGLRLRDLNKILWEHGLGLPVLGSTDSQSLGGLIATDLHGTGRTHGFLSERVRSLTVMAADGAVQTVEAGHPLFHAAFGALGTCGVVVEAVLELVPAFNLVKTTTMVDRAATEANLDALVAAHDHVSFYYVGGDTDSESVRLHTWDHTTEPVTDDWERKKALVELTDFAISAFLPSAAELIAEIDEDSFLSNALAPDHRLVMPGSQGFGRKLFYRHDEIEYGVPFGNWRPCLAEIMELLERNKYFSVVEVRFTPNTSQALLGPGVGRPTAYLELATPLSQPVDAIFAAAERIFLAHGGQPHLGKKTNLAAQDLLSIYQQRFEQFTVVRTQQDHGGKFLNSFAARLFVL